ncbi:DUF1049 domain-containing protein [Actinacidiphila acidipaludis]
MSGTAGTGGTPPGTAQRWTVRDMLTPGRVVVLVLAILALIFIFENTHDVRIRVLIPVVTMPLWGALLITFVVGILCGLYAGYARRRRRR